MVVSIDRDKDRVMVLADDRGLDAPMVREDGVWRRGTFSADDLKDNFERADSNEAETLFHEALAEFESNPSRFKAASHAT